LCVTGYFVAKDSQDQMNCKDILELTQERRDLPVLLATKDSCDQTTWQSMPRPTWKEERRVTQTRRTVEVMEVPQIIPCTILNLQPATYPLLDHLREDIPG